MDRSGKEGANYFFWMLNDRYIYNAGDRMSA